jgi:hypothetical protein
MDRVSIGPVKGLRIALAAFIIGAVGLLCVLALGVYVIAHKTSTVESKVDTTNQFQREIIRSQRESCKKNGNPLREVLIEEQEAALTSPHDPRIHRLFPDAPPALAERVIREGNREHRERIAKLAPVDCAAQYPLP